MNKLQNAIPNHLMEGKKMKVWKKRFLLSLIVLILVSCPTLYLLHRYHIPTWLINNLPVYGKHLKLTLLPVVVSDEEIFKSVADSPFTPKALKQAIDKGNLVAAWDDYQKLRAEHFSSKVVLDPKTLPGFLEYLKQKHPKDLQKIISDADEYASDRFAPFGTEPSILGKDFNWTDFPSRDNDVIYVWEINTLQHFPVLAQAYLLTNNAKYLNTISRHLNSWVAENPIDNSVNWESVMEDSLRLYSLIWTGELLAHDRRAPDLFPKLTKTIYGHARYVAQHIDTPRAKNNHAIFDAMGLYFFAINYPEFKQSKGWKMFAEQRILDELLLQYTPNGIHKEFAPTYQKLLLDGYLYYLVTKRKLNEPVPVDVSNKIKAQLHFLHEVTGPDNRVFLIGDSADHHFLRIGDSSYADAGPTLHLGSLLFSEPEFLGSTKAFDWESIWILGYQLYKDLLPALPDRKNDQHLPTKSMRVYWDEGFFRIDSADVMLFGDFSHFGGEPYLSGHSHCHITSFLMWKDNVPILIDPGTYTYRQSLRSNGVTWRDFLRSSSAHNVTNIDGKSQAEPLGDFEYQSWPDVRILFAGMMDDFFMLGGQHDAYRDLVGRALRVFVLIGQLVVVIDWFPDSTGTHTFENNLIFGTSNVEMRRDVVTFASGGLFYWLANPAGVGRLLKGSYNPPAGWYSTAYGTLRETAQFRGLTAADGPAVSAFLFDFSSDKVSLHNKTPFVVKRLDNGSFILLTRTGHNSIAVLLNPANDHLVSPTSFNNWTTDAQIAAFELKKDGRAMLFNGTYLHTPKGRPKVRVLTSGPNN